MTIACSSYNASTDDSDSRACVAMIPVFALLFVGIGSVFALMNYVSATSTFLPSDARLRNFARFPQGLPDTVRALRYIPAPPPRWLQVVTLRPPGAVAERLKAAVC